MALPMYQRYEIIFLSSHPVGPKLGMKSVANVVKCDKKTVKYWLQRWNEPKDLTDLQHSGRPRITSSEQDEQIVELAQQQTFAASRSIKEDLETKGVEICER